MRGKGEEKEEGGGAPATLRRKEESPAKEKKDLSRELNTEARKPRTP